MADKRRFISPFPSSFCFNFNQQKPKMSYIFSAAFKHPVWKERRDEEMKQQKKKGISGMQKKSTIHGSKKKKGTKI
jgi:hypothetical protein